ncbi:MAG: universal stress protein [Burkholderiales bacterium]
MKTVLLSYYDDDISQRSFELATQLIRRTHGYVEGLFVVRRPEILDGDGSMLADAPFNQLIEESRRAAERSRESFHACAARLALPVVPVTQVEGPAAGWREIEGREQQVVGSHGRLFDLIVVGRASGGGWLNWRVIVESALFESGRPVLVAPDTPVSTFGENVVIAWNASTETARTIAFSMPLLTRARSVTVLSVEGWGVPGPRGEELALYLKRAGVPAIARTIDRNERSPAEAILEECARSGADLLIKGAYTQSRLRQLIFGGATRHVLANAQLPVILAN